MDGERDGGNGRTDALIEALRSYTGRRMFVAVLGSPDPDGLASGWALSLLARAVGVRMDVLTFEVISRPDNLAFARLLAIPFKQVRERLPSQPYEAFAVVDRQNTRLPVPMKKLPLVAHIDHHAATRVKATFQQRDETFGSTSSLMAAHFRWLVDNAALEGDEACRVATALMYGIRTDTGDFLNAGANDMAAASILAPFVSSELLRQIVLTPLGLPFLATLQAALATRVSKEGLTIAFAGRVGGRARDSLGQTADFLARTENTTVMITFGLVDDNVVGSLRTVDPEMDPYLFLDGALSPRLGFPADCGGRRFAGGFQIPVTAFPSPDLDAIRTFVMQAVLDNWTTRGRPVAGRPRSRRKDDVRPGR